MYLRGRLFCLSSFAFPLRVVLLECHHPPRLSQQKSASAPTPHRLGKHASLSECK
jgi:hypothetical protein